MCFSTLEVDAITAPVAVADCNIVQSNQVGLDLVPVMLQGKGSGFMLDIICGLKGNQDGATDCQYIAPHAHRNGSTFHPKKA